MVDNRCCFIDSNIWLYAFVLSGDGTKGGDGGDGTVVTGGDGTVGGTGRW